MQPVSKYIFYLLQTRECVVVPGLGAFVVQRRSASFSGGVLMPPCVSVVFNAAISDDDGLLAYTLGREENIPYLEAQHQVQCWRDAVKARLAGGLDVVLEGLGSLKNVAGHIVFSGADDFAHPDNFGLKPLRLDGYSVSRADEPAYQVVDAAPALRRANDFAFLRSAAVALFALLLWSMVPVSVVDMPSSSDALASVDWTFLQQQKLEHEQAVRDSIEASIEAVKARPYHIVVASLSERAATEYVLHLQSEGFEHVHVIPARNGQQRIAVDACDDYSAAVSQMRSLRLLSPKFSRAWVMTTQ